MESGAAAAGVGVRVISFTFIIFPHLLSSDSGRHNLERARRDDVARATDPRRDATPHRARVLGDFIVLLVPVQPGCRRTRGRVHRGRRHRRHRARVLDPCQPAHRAPHRVARGPRAAAGVRVAGRSAAHAGAEGERAHPRQRRPAPRRRRVGSRRGVASRVRLSRDAGLGRGVCGARAIRRERGGRDGARARGGEQGGAHRAARGGDEARGPNVAPRRGGGAGSPGRRRRRSRDDRPAERVATATATRTAPRRSRRFAPGSSWEPTVRAPRCAPSRACARRDGGTVSRLPSAPSPPTSRT